MGLWKVKEEYSSESVMHGYVAGFFCSPISAALADLIYKKSTIAFFSEHKFFTYGTLFIIFNVLVFCFVTHLSQKWTDEKEEGETEEGS